MFSTPFVFIFKEFFQKIFNMFRARILFFSFLFFGLMFEKSNSMLSRTGFVSNYLNDWNCRLSLMNAFEGFNSIFESYFNKSGEFCKIYCRIRKTDSKEVIQKTLNAPDFSCCGLFKLCLSGHCVEILKSADQMIRNVHHLFRKAINSTKIPSVGDSGQNRNPNMTNKTDDLGQIEMPTNRSNPNKVTKQGDPLERETTNILNGTVSNLNKSEPIIKNNYLEWEEPVATKKPPR